MTDVVIQHHRGLFRGLLERHKLQYALVLDAADDVLGAWFLGGSAYAPGPAGPSNLPIQPPFGRNAAYLVPREGEILRYAQIPPHPTDPQQYPVMPCRKLDWIFGHGPVGIIHGSALKKTLRDRLMQAYPGLTLVELTEAFERCRAQKSPEEVEGMKRAARLFGRVFSSFPVALREGRTEHDAAVDIRFRFYQMKACAEDMGQLIRLKLRSAPDGSASVPAPLEYPGRRLAYGDRINLSVTGYSPEGYASALGRCYTLGKASDEARRYWKLAVEAQDMAAARIRPGASLKTILPELQAAIWEAHGLSPDLSGWICGMGLSRFEAPRPDGPSDTLPFAPGMTLAVGPKITPAGKDSYCCLDMYVVTEHGCERISDLPRELIEL